MSVLFKGDREVTAAYDYVARRPLVDGDQFVRRARFGEELKTGLAVE